MKHKDQLKKGRNERKTRRLKLGRYLIVTDSKETEPNYPSLYQNLQSYGDETKAIARASKRYEETLETQCRPSEMLGCTTVYQLVSEIRSKISIDA